MSLRNEKHRKGSPGAGSGRLLKNNEQLQAEITERFGVLPNFFTLPEDYPDITGNLWEFAQFGYLDNPLPPVFKERLFVYLSRFCKVRYCITRHLGFLIGLGNVAGDENISPQPLTDVIKLLEKSLPEKERLGTILQRLDSLPQVLVEMPKPNSELEEAVFASAAHVFLETPDATNCQGVLKQALNDQDYQYLLLFLTFIRTAHYWSGVQTSLNIEDDLDKLLSTRKELAELLLNDPVANFNKTSQALMNEVESLRREKKRIERLLADEQLIREKREIALIKSNRELEDKVAKLEKLNRENRISRHAALNLMEDAILSQEALRKSEEKYRTKLEQDVRDRTAQLNTSKEFLQATMDASMDMIQVFEAVRNENNEIIDFRYLLVNHKAEKWMPDVIGKSFLQQQPGVVMEGIFDAFREVVETGIPQQYEKHYVHEQFNGWFHQSVVKLGDGVATTTTDITERKLAALEIFRLKDEIAQKATDKYYSLFNSIDEGFHISELLYNEAGEPVDFRYLEVNDSFERLTSLKDVVGKAGSQVFPDVERYLLEAYDSVVKTGEPIRFEEYNQYSDRWYRTYVSRVGGADSNQIAVVFDDITQRKQQEQRQDYLLSLNDAIRSESDPGRIQKLATELLGKHLDVNQAHFAETNGDVVSIQYSYGKGISPMIGKFNPQEFGEQLIEGISAGKIHVCDNTSNDPTISDAERNVLAAASIGAYIAVPLINNKKWVATLAVNNITPRVWKDAEIQLVEETAERTWAAVERAAAEEALRINEARMRRQKEALQSAIRGAALDVSLNLLTHLVVEETAGKARTAFYITNTEGTGLYTVRGAGNMPTTYADEVDGFMIGENSLARVLAVPTGTTVVTPDVFEEPRWKPWVFIAEKYDYRSCWSFPIKTREDRAIGIFAMYFKEASEATGKELALADVVTQTAAVIIANNTDTIERARAETALQQNQLVLAKELEDARLLQQISTRIIEEDNIQELYGAILASAMDIMNADAASIQLLIPQRNELYLLAHRNFHPDSAKFWQRVNIHTGSSFGRAMEVGRRVIVENVNDLDNISENDLNAYRLSGLIATQSTPLVNRNGNQVGMISTLWRTYHRPTDRELNLFDVVARQAADLIERKKSEEALQQSEERLRLLADSVPQVIWANDGKGKANYFNRRWYEYTGLNYEESAGPGWQAIVHHEDAPSSVARWKEAMEAGRIFDTEFRLRNYEGVYRWFIGRNVPLKDDAGELIGWFGSATDIDDLKKTTAALSQSEARLWITMESATDYAIITMDADRKIEKWSQGAVQLFGYTEAEIKGQPADIIFTEEDRHAGIPQREMETARDTGRAADDRWHKGKDGHRFYVNGVMRPIQNSELTGYVKVMRDMTQQQLFTEELHRLVAERTIELNRSNDDLRQFAHVASHDLKEPIRKIQTFNSRILDEYSDALPAKVKIYAQKISTAAERMISMIEGVLRYSKLGNAEQVMEMVDLNEIVQQVINDLEILIQQKQAIVTATELPTLKASPTLLYQLFYNLALNSLKFAKAEEPSQIRISSEKLKLDKREYIRIIFADNGIGFKQEFAQYIFKTFTRLHPTEDYEGTGLGLALCKKIVERHGGTISASGELDKGATFTILLPLEGEMERE